MKKSTVFIALAVIILLVVGSAVWLSLSNPSTTADNGGTPASSESGTPPNTTDATDETEVKISISDMSFSPATVKIKKGTTVTWTNNDTIGHNVVADDANNSGGLPASHALMGQGETFSHTFGTVGTFTYHCTPHPFMKGTVEVVE